MTATLSLIVDSRLVRRFPLGQSRTSIGRAPDNDIVINHAALSRRHAELRRTGQKFFEVVDLGSQNGVFVNGTRVSGSQRLHHGDQLTLAHYLFRFEERETRTPPASKTVAPQDVPQLILWHNGRVLKRIPLQSDSVCRVGRDPECELCIDEKKLSRRHCKISARENMFFVEDLGSQNGTYVNQQRIRTPHRLQHHDRINFADYFVEFVDPPAVSAAHRLPPKPQKSAGHFEQEPLTETPHNAKERRDKQIQQPKLSPAAVPLPARLALQDVDVDDHEADVQDDPVLEQWYAQRLELSALSALELSSAHQLDALLTADSVEAPAMVSQKKHRRFSLEVRLENELRFQGVLDHAVTALGCDEEADIQLSGEQISPYHVLLVQVRDSLLLVRLGSATPVLVNGAPKLQAFLKGGDLIQMGKYTLKIIEAATS